MEKTLTRPKTKHSPPPPPSAAKRRHVAADFERRTRRRLSGTTATADSGELDDDGEQKEKPDDGRVEEKIAALQKIVPGGAALGIDALFEETAGYIVAMQFQIKAMKLLTAFLERLEKQNMKFGG